MSEYRWVVVPAPRSGRAITSLRPPGALLAALFAVASFGCNACGASQKDAETTAPVVTASPAPEASSDAPGADSTSTQNVSGGCAIGGCSGELCVEGTAASEPTVSNCQYERHFECFKEAKCGRDAQNQCNWEQTPLLTKCLQRKGG